LDIGANYGAFSLWVAEKVPGARLIAVEPFPDCYARLAHHVKFNELAGRIETWQAGLGERSEYRYMNADAIGNGSSPTQSRACIGDARAGAGSSVVPVFSIEDLIARACEAFGREELDFVKLDVEGIEHAALSSASVNALRRIRALNLEYHPNGSKAKLFRV